METSFQRSRRFVRIANSSLQLSPPPPPPTAQHPQGAIDLLNPHTHTHTRTRTRTRTRTPASIGVSCAIMLETHLRVSFSSCVRRPMDGAIAVKPSGPNPFELRRTGVCARVIRACTRARTHKHRMMDR